MTGFGWDGAYPTSPRATLAAAFETAFGDGVQIYKSPPDTLAPPCIVINPADPYQVPYTAAGSDASAWAFELDIVLRRNRSDLALDELERARELVCTALPSGWRWVDFGSIGEIVVGKKTFLKGTLAVAVPFTGGMT